MRWLRLGIGAALIIWLLVMARREALRHGRPALAAALPMAGGAILCFLVAITPINPELSNLFMLATLLLVAAAVGVLLWMGFR